MTTQIDTSALYWVSFNRFELRIPGEAVADLSMPGPADSAADYWADPIREQVERDNFTNRPTPDAIREELAEYGAWDGEELADDDANWRRLIWIAACNIAEEENPDSSEPLTAKAA